MPIDASQGPASPGGGTRTAPSEPQVVYAAKQTEQAAAEMRIMRAALNDLRTVVAQNTAAQEAILAALNALAEAVTGLRTDLDAMRAKIEANNGASERMIVKLPRLP